MKDFLNDPEQIKDKILPGIEKRIRNQIIEIVNQRRNSGDNKSREELYQECLNEFYSKLGVHSIHELFEKEFINILSTFQKNFPYKSVDHLIESTLKTTFTALNKALGTPKKKLE
jgi:hypothetical protein